MKKRLILIVAPIVLSLIYILSISVNNPGVNYPINIGDFKVVGSSRIEPETILSSLDYGDKNIFDLKSGLPEETMFIKSIEWTQADFLKISSALFRVVWNEPINEWHLYRMEFWTACKNNPKGFSSSELYFYQEISGDKGKQYSVRDILVEPEYGYVAWGGETFYPRSFFKWKSIDLSDKILTAEDALIKAEASGGAKSRQAVENKCKIIVSMYPDRDTQYGWSVYYSAGYEAIQGLRRFWIPAK